MKTVILKQGSQVLIYLMTSRQVYLALQAEWKTWTCVTLKGREDTSLWEDQTLAILE